MSFSEDDDETLDIKPIMTAYSEDRIFSADEVPLAEKCFEIEYDESSNISETTLCLKSLEKDSRFYQLLSPIPSRDLKSPLDTHSDCGYGSQSPGSSVHDHELGINDINEDFNFLELFPSLA